MIVENINEFEIKLLFPEDRLEAIEKLIAQKNFVSAEIAARLLMEDYPGHEVGGQLLHKVLELNGTER